MIPDFKTYLKESVWGSIRKKSLGLETRIEDDVNKLDGEAFVGYIKQHYKCVGTEYEPFIDVKKCITVPLFVVSNKTQFLSFNEKTDTVYLSEHSMLKNNPVYDQLHNEFSLEEKAYSCPGHFTKDDIIRPKMGYGSKKFFLEVIDFLLENTGEPFKPVLIKKDSVNESVWGDIRKKSIGQEERKETSIDEYPIDNFFKYLKDTYDTVSESYLQTGILNSGNKYINTTIFVQGQNYISLFYNDERKDEIYFNIMKHEKFEPLVTSRITAFISIIKDVFVVRDTHPSDKQQEGYGIKSSKEYPKGRNTLYRKVLNMAIIAFSPKTEKDSYMAIKPKDPSILNESVWGNIRNKSLGMETRTEDSADHLNQYDFYEYLIHTYKSVPINGSYKPIEISKSNGVITVPIVFYDKKSYNMYIHEKNRTCVSIIIDIDEIYQECIDDLKSKYDVEIKDQRTVTSNDMCIRIYQKNHKNEPVSNNFCVKLIDFILDMDKPLGNAIEKKVNESVWGDIRKKSIGQETRIEDDINLMDYEELGNYILKNYNLADEDGLSWRYTRGDYIGVNIFIIRLDDNDNVLEYFTDVDNDNSKKVTVYPNIKELDPNLYNKLNEKYKLYDTEDRWGMMSLLGIDPKEERDIDNKFFIEVLNFIIDNLDSKYRKIIDR